MILILVGKGILTIVRSLKSKTFSLKSGVLGKYYKGLIKNYI